MLYSPRQEVKTIEKYIDQWEKAKKIGAGNITLVSTNPTYSTDLENSKYQDFIGSADYHYFIGRILFVRGAGIYGFFCAQQCIENYLKAYFIFKGGKLDKKLTKNSHDLGKWLDRCKNYSTKGSFLHTRRSRLIVEKYDPFNELPRYPVTRRGIQGSYGYIQPHDIFPLDYFVYKIRKEVPLPSGVWDIFNEERPYSAGSLDKNDPLVLTFKDSNINFP